MRHGSIPGAHGRVRPLSLLGDPVLHTRCEDVTDFGPELARLVEDMFATMYAAQGVGLAANQVGEPLRVFVYDCPDDEDVRHLGHVVNPRLVEADGIVLRGTRLRDCFSFSQRAVSWRSSSSRSARSRRSFS
ncbi:peptide deformylase, partial [Streptomyces asoensis]|uniref:peptide deformylase n=1 Tax=Streptomyces asoensis TaxID=249586 RepID=UPI0034037C0F